jgi:bifunctional UDP-N-acetylglucosamine pyrophosphorylase/glucosamine-1-phosphate N-acetyltransferase
MVRHVVEAVRELGAERVVVVVGAGRKKVEECLSGTGVEVAVQERPRGTGDAARAGLESLADTKGDVLILPGDTPLIEATVLADLVKTKIEGGFAGVVLTFSPEDAGRYGRVIRGENGRVVKIVEAKDAVETDLAVGEVNSGMYCFDLDALREALPKIGADNAAGEYYLTDVIELLVERGVGAVKSRDPRAVLGVNTPSQLAGAAAIMRARLVEDMMSAGVAVHDPATTYVEVGVEVGEGTTILPFTVLRRGVRVGKDCTIGPFTHLREGSEVGDGAWVGAFVEMKASRLGEDSTAGHLAYLGDAEVGRSVTVGGGVVTANYDGCEKHRTIVGDGAMIGVGTALVAPVRVGKGAVTGAGSVVTRGKDVGDGEVVMGVPARSVKSGIKPRGAKK